MNIFSEVKEYLTARQVAENYGLQITKRGRYMKPEEKMIAGTFISNGRGFGFIEVEGEVEDYFVPEDKIHGAFHQDTVQAVVIPGQHGKRKEAEIVNIISRGMQQIVGIFEKSKNFGFVIPDNSKIAQDIFIPLLRRMLRKSV